MSVQDDIEKFVNTMQTDLTTTPLLNKNDFSGSIEFFNKPYMFSNEYLYQYLSKLNFKGKSVLTTGSSGDQILFSLLFGAKDVTCFDINPFAKYIFNLKAAYIKTLSYQQFYSIVTNKGNGFNELFNYANYQMVAPLLDQQTKYFWDSLFASGLNPDTSMFTHSNRLDMFKCKYITDCVVYNNLKNVLKTSTAQIDFITCDLRDLPNKLDNTKQYDFILLSNIFDYVHTWQTTDDGTWGYDVFPQIVHKLASEHLTSTGKIQVGYCYNNMSYNQCTDVLMALFGANKVKTIAAGQECDAIFYTPQKAKQSISTPPVLGL